jgi:NAD(P)-dependent dehydrogenase (short-subunit alcohol dehydrogenase family)
MRLRDKVAVITGGGSGIGRETCLLFAEEGARVIVADRDQGAAQHTVDLIAAAGGAQAYAFPIELANEEDNRRLADFCRTAAGRVDVLVNNAGVRVWGPVTEMSEQDWEFILSINLKAPGLTAKYLIPLMEQSGGGSIVNVSSANAVAGRKGMALYDASKAGLAALTRSMACDHAEANIRVNAILPGPTLTDFHIKRAQAAGRHLDERVTERNPNGPGILKRQAKPREIAYGILFLACDESSYVTGACLNVDGGLTALTQRS